jgi:hypothetical protein
VQGAAAHVAGRRHARRVRELSLANAPLC